jgi:AraC-like DNA-binding protein
MDDFFIGPERLMNEKFMTLSSPFRIYQTTIDQNVDTHWHEFYEMAFVMSGSGTHVLNGNPIPVSRGHSFLLTPADFHAIVPDSSQPLHIYNLIFTDRFIRDNLMPHIFEKVSIHSGLFPDAECEFIEHEYKRIWEEAGNWRSDSEYIVQGTIERLLIDLSRKCRQAVELPHLSGSALVHAGVRKSLIYIQHHFRTTVSLDEVASYCGLSTNYFSECFRKTIGVTFQEYVKESRLNFAKSLLSTTPLPVTDICFASGFNTLPYFERAFKHKFAVSPRDYRKRSMG